MRSGVLRKARDNVVVWGGGLWEWLDPATAVDAIVRLNDEGLRAKLLFLGRARPSRSVIDRRREDRIDALLQREPRSCIGERGLGPVSRAALVVARGQSGYHAPPSYGGG